MNIIQCITRGDTYYGAQSHFLELSCLLSNAGHNVTAVLGSTGELTDRLRSKGVAFEIVPSLQRSIHPLRDTRAVSELRSLFRQIRPDIIACHSSKAGILGRLAAQRERIPNVFTAHGWSFEENIPAVPRTLYTLLERWIGKRTSRFIAVSQAGLDLGIRQRVAKEQNISVVHYGVADQSVCDNANTRSDDGSDDVFEMTMVAGFRKQKDHPTLFKALSGLMHLQWRCNLVGDGELLAEMKDLAEQMGLADRLIFHGAIRDVPSVLKRTDLMVLITNWEGLPISIIEGLSLGLPAVASDVSGVREEVIDGMNGNLVRHRDAAHVRQVLAELIDDSIKLKRYSAAARQLYEQQFTNDVMLQKTLDVYRQAIQNSEPSWSGVS